MARTVPAERRVAVVLANYPNRDGRVGNGVGFDTVDVAACSAKGVIVTNTPFAIRRPVAVAALTHIFALSGKLLIKDRLVRTGRWNERVEHMGLGLTSRTLGLIGAGGIGQELRMF